LRYRRSGVLPVTSSSCDGRAGIAPFLGALVVLMVIALAGCASEEATAIIERAKAATGGKAWDQIAIWHEVGEVTSATGEKSRYEHWQNFHSLATRNIGGGEMDHMIFDGHEAYGCPNPACDPPRPLDATLLKGGAYQVGYGFFFPDRFPASFQYEGSRVDHGVHYDVVKVSPTNLDPFEIWIDSTTHLIYRLADPSRRFQWDLSDYRRVGSVTVPFTEVSSGATVHTESITFEPAGSVSFSLSAEP